jgi:hypothetical protein
LNGCIARFTPEESYQQRKTASNAGERKTASNAGARLRHLPEPIE